MHLKKAVFFDLDDTLYDHLEPLELGVREVLGTGDKFPYERLYHRVRYYSDLLSATQGLSPKEGGSVGAAGTMTLEEMRRERFQLALGEFDYELTDEKAQALQDAYLSKQYAITLYKGARELIMELQDAGRLVGVITNGPPEHQLRKAEALGLQELISPELIFVSRAVRIAKPDVRLFEHVNRATETSPENSFYIGDSWRNDVVGAIDAGWTVLWFNPRLAKRETDHEPHYTAADYSEIRRIVLGL
ncbi:HAD family hydrolase [Saccharibacillus kuerlensis]|uniref:Haloacid dehalogenase n=1 Tax=Saccharibacillus kuerlensis TaxID=459527 RepID=A0ABQ2KTB2_9BACL|nr:HAD family hydrolase [Saccharibacillus kuerlensis]GGN92635.1 haloacid dehalogenase [Saccharibacillus kuerlensis]